MIALILAACLQEPVKPGPHHEHLKKMEGTWNAVLKADFQGQKSESKGVETNTMVCGGLWLLGEFKCEVFGQPYEGRALFGYDSAKKKYVGTLVDTMADALVNAEGTCDGTGKVWTLTYEFQGVKFQQVMEWKDDRTRVMTMTMDGKEVMVITYTRAGFEIPKTATTKEGWEVYENGLTVNEEMAPGADSPEAAVAHFYASLMRGDEKYLDVLPPRDGWSDSLKRKMKEVLSWKFVEVRMERRKIDKDRAVIKLWMKIEFDGKSDSGTDDIEVEKAGGKWIVVRPPT